MTDFAKFFRNLFGRKPLMKSDGQALSATTEVAADAPVLFGEEGSNTVLGLFGGYLTPAELEDNFRNQRHWHASAMPSDYRDECPCFNTPLGMVGVNTKFKIPETGGISRDARIVYFDQALPQFFDINGRTVDVWQFLVIHERIEKHFMDMGCSYEDAHRAATLYEHAAVRSCGLSPTVYERVLRPWITRDEHESGGDLPQDLELKPYAHSKLHLRYAPL